jgi:hypothetical protein
MTNDAMTNVRNFEFPMCLFGKGFPLSTGADAAGFDFPPMNCSVDFLDPIFFGAGHEDLAGSFMHPI